MLLLAIDTSQKNGSVTLAHAGKPIETVAVEGGMFSAQLVPTIASLLAKHDIGRSQIEGFTVCVGPGSFTGLRIGLAAVKGFAEVLKRPIATVSALEAVASLSAVPHVIAVLDAGRKELYAGEYRRDGTPGVGHLICAREFLTTAQQLVAQPLLFVTPSEEIAVAMRALGANVELVPAPSSVEVAQIGAAKFARGESVTADALEANYVRQDAGLFQKQL